MVFNTVLPLVVDLREKFKEVTDQGATRACVGHSVASTVAAVTGDDVSPSFIYYNARQIFGNSDSDTGCLVSSAIQGILNKGYASSVEKSILTKPQPEIFEVATKSATISAFKVSSLLEFRTALASGLPVVFGFRVTGAFKVITKATGELPYPVPDDSLYGWHSVSAVGYDDNKQNMLCRNSFGPAWGKDGYFTMDYKWFDNIPDLVKDAWVIIPKNLNV